VVTRGGPSGVPSGLLEDGSIEVDGESAETCMADGSPSSTGDTGRSGADRRPRILIVDDEPLIGTTLRVLLSDDHDVVLAQSGALAREELTRGEFDLILCDLMMPHVSGMDLHRWLYERSPDAAGRMVFMTGGVFTDDARQFLDDVPNRRIDKPFDTQELLQAMCEELGRPRAR
jgi:CheY-like chemotaxis protein